MQLELREAVERKQKEGFEVVQRDPIIVMRRGASRITLEPVAERVIIKNA